jgi:cyclophilin family peptidyl-prolyl cis-trans isomerase
MKRKVSMGFHGFLVSLLGFLVLSPPLLASAEDYPSVEPRVLIQTTMGDFVIELDSVRAPLTTANFLNYVREGFYDKTLVHRVIPNFVVQGGGYNADYSAKPLHGPIPNESGNGLSNSRGTVGMARGDSPHSATSQFNITLNDNGGLNPLPSRWGYAVFGKVVQGMDVVENISHVATGAGGTFTQDAPLRKIFIVHAQIIGEKPTTAPAVAAPAESSPAPSDEPPPADAGEAQNPAQAPASETSAEDPKSEPTGEARP